MKLQSSLSPGFTLVEILVSLVVVGIISAASWTAISVLSPAAEVSRNRLMAENLLTKSQEEAIRIAQTQFDTLEACNKVASNCWSNISTQFSGFTRTLTITAVSSEFKRVHALVGWEELGQKKTRESLLMLARPAEAMPGNVMGLVSNSMTNQPIKGVSLTLSSNLETTSQSLNLETNNNYSFVEDGTLRFRLNPGTYRLKVTMKGYRDFERSDITVGSNQEQKIDVEMVPLPAEGHITGRLVNADTLMPINFSGDSRIHLFDNGTVARPATSGSNSGKFDFTVPFTDTDRRCFTLNTTLAYHSKYVGRFTPHCAYNYEPDGWSAAVVNADRVADCSLSWNGSSTTDRICVAPGETTNPPVDIPLVPVPTATVTGRVLNASLQGIQGAKIVVNWHGGRPGWSSNGRSEQGGFYSVQVPAEQELFANAPENYVEIHAEINGTHILCCGEVSHPTLVSPTKEVGPLYAGGRVDNQDLRIDTLATEEGCGNATGKVKDVVTGADIQKADVTIVRESEKTNSMGAYTHDCRATAQPAKFRIPATAPGVAVVTAAHSAYYTFESDGNSYYRASFNGVKIVEKATAAVPLISLWPKGYGTVSGTVRQGGTLLPLSGITVTVSSANGTQSILTKGDGTFQFTHVQETWPPPLLKGNTAYIQNGTNNTLKAEPDETLYTAPSSKSFKLNANQSLPGQDFVLESKPGS